MAQMNLLEQFARHIEFLGFGDVADEEHDGTIFYGRMPDTPDRCVCVFSSDSQFGGSDKPARIQLYVRDKFTKDAYEYSQAIVEGLLGSDGVFDGFLAGDGAHVSIEAINTSNGIGTDSRNRELYSSNFYVYYCDF